MILILFDNGGTLVTDPFFAVLRELCETWSNAEEAVLRSYFTEDSFVRFVNLWERENAMVDFPFASHFLQEERWIIGALEKLSTTRLDQAAIPIVSPRVLAIYRARARTVIETQPQLPVIRSALTTLKLMGFDCIAVASNDRDFATRAMLKWAGLDVLFDFILTSEMLSSRTSVIEKPNPEFYRRAEKTIAHSLSISSFESKIYIGDNEGNDIVVPNSLGYSTVRYFISESSTANQWNDSPSTTSATASYRSPTELLECLQRLIRSQS